MALVLAIFINALVSWGCAKKEDPPVGMAVEFNDHAVAYIALDKGWFEKEGVILSACDSYVTGMALCRPGPGCKGVSWWLRKNS